MRVWPGRPAPLGATWDGAGVNFALFAESAAKVELCLFDSADTEGEPLRVEGGVNYDLPDRSLVLFRQVPLDEPADVTTGMK